MSAHNSGRYRKVLFSNLFVAQIWLILVQCNFLTFSPFVMFSRVASSCSTHFGKCFSKFSQSANRLSHFVNQSSRSYSTGSAACRLIDTSNYPLVSPFQLGFAVAAGLGCGAALLYGNRLFAVEVTTWRWRLMHRIRNP